MKRAVIVAVMVALAALLIFVMGFGGASGRRASDAEGTLSAAEVVKRNIDAAGGPDALARMRTLSFASGADFYSVSADGRMKIRSSFELPVVFQTVLVEPSGARRNSLGRIEEIRGMDRVRLRALARLAGGAFTLKNFAGPWTSTGVRTYGPRRYYVLTASDDGTGLTFNVDAEDFLVKRLVLNGGEGGSENWELSIELGPPQAAGGLNVPSMIFVSRPGISQTSSPGPRPIVLVKANEALPADFFETLEVNAGETQAAAGRLKGRVLGALFEPGDLFVRIFTNWTEKEVLASGLKSGEMLTLRSGGGEFESRFLFVEDDAQPEFGIYEAGHSFLTHNPTRYPMFYVQFNRLEPREKFEELRAKVKVMGELEAVRPEERR